MVEPPPAAVWYAVATRPVADAAGWLLRISMTVAVDGGPREDHQVHDVDAACALLRSWFDQVTALTP